MADSRGGSLWHPHCSGLNDPLSPQPWNRMGLFFSADLRLAPSDYGSHLQETSEEEVGEPHPDSHAWNLPKMIAEARQTLQCPVYLVLHGLVFIQGSTSWLQSRPRTLCWSEAFYLKSRSLPPSPLRKNEEALLELVDHPSLGFSRADSRGGADMAL